MQQHLKCGSKIDLELQDLFDGTTRESPMKRYYFDIRDGSQFIRDDEGAELPNIDLCSGRGDHCTLGDGPRMGQRQAAAPHSS
ncbi:DUF6894 family protein [Bradyrhizobium sp. RDT10]